MAHDQTCMSHPSCIPTNNPMTALEITKGLSCCQGQHSNWSNCLHASTGNNDEIVWKIICDASRQRFQCVPFNKMYVDTGSSILVVVTCLGTCPVSSSCSSHCMHIVGSHNCFFVVLLRYLPFFLLTKVSTTLKVLKQSNPGTRVTQVS